MGVWRRVSEWMGQDDEQVSYHCDEVDEEKHYKEWLLIFRSRGVQRMNSVGHVMLVLPIGLSSP